MDPQALVVIVSAIALGSLIKGVTGSGLPQIAIPVMAIFLGVEHSVVVMAIPGMVSNAWLIWRFRSHFDQTRDLPMLLTAGTVGAIGGTYLLKALDPRILSAVLALIIVVYVITRLTRPELELAAATTRRMAAPIGLAAGTLQGATGISGPLVSTWLHAYRLPPPVYVIALVTMFQVFGTVQFFTLIGLGLFTTSRVIEGMLALIPMAIALPIGARLATRMSAKTFDIWILVLLLASAGKLGHSAIWG